MAVNKTINLNVKTKGTEKAKQQFTAIGNVLRTAVAGGIITGIAHLSKMAASAEGVERAFNRLNKPDLLRQLKEATQGTVANLELMKRAVTANQFKISLEQLPTLLKFAHVRARETGQSVDYLVDSIVTGIGRKSPLILDNLGLSAIEVREKFKKTGDMAKAVGEIINEEFAKGGEYAKTLADEQERVAATAQDVELALGKAINKIGTSSGIFDILQKGLRKFALDMQDLFGGQSAETIAERIELYKEKLQEFYTVNEKGVRVIQQDNMKAYMDWSGQIKELQARLKELQEGEEGVAGATDKINTAAIEAEKRYLAWVDALEKKQAKDREELAFQERYGQTLIAQLEVVQGVIDVTGIQIRQQEEIVEKIEKVKRKTTDSQDEFVRMAEAIEQRTQRFGDIFGNVLFNSLTASNNIFTAIGENFKRLIQDMIATLIANAAVFQIFNLLGVTGAGSLFGGGSLLGLLGFQHGGSFTVGGQGGADSQLVAFRASPGERVSVETPAQQNVRQEVVINLNGREMARALMPEINKQQMGYA